MSEKADFSVTPEILIIIYEKMLTKHRWPTSSGRQRRRSRMVGSRSTTFKKGKLFFSLGNLVRWMISRHGGLASQAEVMV